MHIVLPGALPDPGAATELASRLAEVAPTLARWLERARAETLISHAADTRCTPLEHWLLEARGFRAAHAQHLSAGLGPLRAPGLTDDEPIWLAELTHMAPSRDGAALLTADTLDITDAQARALFESARDALEEIGIAMDYGDQGRWRVRWPEGFTLPCASPALVAASSVNDWWPQEDAARPWRRLVNFLQMQWHEHPVNVERARAGRAPINSLWLYGGARASQLARPLPDDTRIHDDLYAPALAQDWGGWLEALRALEAAVFAPQQERQPTLVLTGRERVATLAARTGWFARLRKDDWRSWWSHP
ncbi:hypothetical protein [Castellaniella sp. GW247-6E4]|uniref:hypothetical protein n=1 Tax=Castellaniella sp. GW247-6E4 TaxID=3140380 RepID=UPI0033146DDB